MNSLFKYISKYKFVIMTFVLIILVIILIALILFLNKKPETPQHEVSTSFNSEILSEKTNNQLSGDSKFLVVCQESNANDVVFLSLIDFKIFSEKIIVTPLDFDTQTNSGTFREKYAYGGISLLLQSVENERNIEIDRYVVINREGFCDIIDLMGEVDLYVDEEFTYLSSEKSYNIEIGNNTLEAPMLYSYLKLKSDNSNDIVFTELLCKIINSYLSEIDESEALKYFEDLSNCINSDLSISDYYSAENDIKHILKGKTTCIPYYEGE